MMPFPAKHVFFICIILSAIAGEEKNIPLQSCTVKSGWGRVYQQN